jgi:glycine/sarcosine N-methyltransferase
MQTRIQPNGEMKNRIPKALTPELFYDVTSEFYEQMIDFEKNLRLRISAYKNIFAVPGKTADLGCGVGLDSIALAFNKHNVTAFDISDKMVSAAKLNGEKYGVKIKAYTSSIHSIPKKYNVKFNYVVCVGNTIAHLNQTELKKSFKGMHKMLLPGGKLFLHILNYSLFQRENKRINNISVRGDKTIIRFHDFLEKNIGFNILTFSNTDPKNYQIISTSQYVHTKDEIFRLLNNVGFSKCKASSTFSGEKYKARESKDLFIEAWKGL